MLLLEIAEGFHYPMHTGTRRRIRFQSSNLQEILDKCNVLIPEVAVVVKFKIYDMPFVSFFP